MWTAEKNIKIKGAYVSSSISLIFKTDKYSNLSLIHI